MYFLRDLLVCGPVFLTLLYFRDAGWMQDLIIGALLYGSLRVLSEWAGLEQLIRDRHNAKIAGSMAQRAVRAADGRSRGEGSSSSSDEEGS